MVKLSGPSTFTWTNDEQIWPFEKDKFGNTLYARRLEIPAGGGATGISVAAPFLSDPHKIFKLEGFFLSSGGYALPIQFYNAGNVGDSHFGYVSNSAGGSFIFWGGSSASDGGWVNLIYSK